MLSEDYSVGIVDDKWKKAHTKKDVLLFPNVSILKGKRRFLDKFDGVGIVFDSPTNLYGIKNLKFLDVQAKPETLSYRFALQDPDFSVVDNAFDRTSKVKWRNVKILDTLVVERTKTEKTTIINNYLYFCTNHTNRITSMKAICEYLLGIITKAELLEIIPSGIDFYYKKMLRAITDKAFHNACIKAEKTQKPEAIAKETGFEVYDIKWPKRNLKRCLQLLG